jgi:hypothetical protein
MGLHGPIRDPGSRRGAKEMPGYQPDQPDLPQPPRWLSGAGKTTFTGLVADLAAAQVPIKMADAHAVAMAAHCLTEAQVWAHRAKTYRKTEDKIEAAKLCARFQRDSQQWLNAICATPTARARIGLRGGTTTKKPGRVLSIIQSRENRQ